MSNGDVFELLHRNPRQTMGICVVVLAVCLIVSAVFSTGWPMAIASVPLAVLGLTYIANSPNVESTYLDDDEDVDLSGGADDRGDVPGRYVD